MSRQPGAIREGGFSSASLGKGEQSFGKDHLTFSIEKKNLTLSFGKEVTTSFGKENQSPSFGKTVTPSLREESRSAVRKPHRLQPPPQNTPDVSSRRRKLRLVRNQLKKDRSFHIASVDDYDDTNADLQKEAILFPFLTYDPGLLDTAVILVATSRTQNVFVGFVVGVPSRRRKAHTCSCLRSATCGSSAFSPPWRNWSTCRSGR